MGFFSKKRNDNNGFIINTDDEAIKVSGDKNLAPHAMTPEEVSDLWVLGDEVQYTQTSALDSLKKRMNVAVENANNTIQQPKTTAFEKEPQKQEPKPTTFKAPVEKDDDDKKSDSVIFDAEKTLVEKVKRYTIDEKGKDVSENQQPIYELQSVAEIIMNDGESAMKDLSKKYGLDIVVDDLGKSKDDTVLPEEVKETKAELDLEQKKNVETTPTPAFEKMVSDAEEREATQLFESLFPSETPSEIPDISIPDISDIDTHEVGINANTDMSNTATVRFTPIKDSKGNTDHITISSITKHIDLGDNNIPQEISSRSVTKLEHTEFDDFVPKEEYTNLKSGKKLLINFAKQKRFYFIGVFVSALMVFVLSIFLLSPVQDFVISSTKTAMFICTAFLFVSVLTNIDMFLEFKNLLNRRSNFDVLMSWCSTLVIGLGVVAALTSTSAYYLILLCSILLFVRAVCKFKSISAKQKSLRQITTDRAKNAVTLINDPATTFAMAKNSIEGDVLIAAHRKTHFVKNFMKHFEFHKTMFGKVSIVFFVTVALSAICGLIAYFYCDSDKLFNAVYSAASIACISAIPTAFFIDTLPFSSVAKKLSKKGAAIAGIYGAEKIETANAAVVNINDIFPSGTITMHNMQVLSNNNIDDILLRAASLTAAVNSPLESIFKKIAGTNSSYSIPDSDTVKYEKNLGISGWVNNELLFIGNRSLMKAHGIAIPNLEVDKKILRKGFFPVYVATANTACALIVIQYNIDPDVSKELHKITDLGVLLLVENCDPNITENMLCDYFGLYDDSVKIMTSAGLHMYKNAVPEKGSCSAPAVFRHEGLSFISIINSATSLKRCNILLTVLYALFAIFGVLYFIYAAFSGLMSMPQQTTVLLYSLVTTVISIIGFLIRKP